ncbi:MAG: TetR family transcriptional regulator [Pararhodobacter sp.]|nr:TetR family transcriptional regulator [Pararhodobacter sp.]
MNGQNIDVEMAEAESGSDRVRELLEISAQLFAERGFDATSMRDISKAANVSKALLYHHFTNKDDIYARVALSSSRHLNDFVEERIPADGTAAERVRAFMVATASFFAQHRPAWIAASNAFWTDRNRQRVDERMARRDQFEKRLRQLIREGIEAGEFREVDPADAGRLVLSAINWMHRWFDPEKELSAEEIAARYADLILHGMKRG